LYLLVVDEGIVVRTLKLLLFDLLLVAIATALALALRDNFEVTEERFAAFIPYLLMTLAVATVISPLFGINRSVWRFTALTDYLRLVAAGAAIVAGAVALGFAVNRLEGVARAVPIIQGLLIIFALVGARVLMRLRHAIRSRPVQLVTPVQVGGPEMVLVVGLNKVTNLYLQSVSEFASDRLRIAGLLDLFEHGTRRTVQGLPVLGTVEQIGSALQDLAVHGMLIDRVVVTLAFDKLSPEAQAALLEVEKKTSIRLEFLAERLGLDPNPQRAEEKHARHAESSNAADTFLIHPADLTAVAQRPYVRLKRMLDILGAGMLLILLGPIMLLVAMLVAVDVGRPVVFWQQRPGLGGRPFKLYKFRTMSAAHDASGHRIPDTERLAGIGLFLRRTRLDELPQLFSILIGDMSFVGPRPLLPIDQPKGCAARLLVRPGLTGWAQIKGGRSLSAADKGPLDLWYVQNISLTLDVSIILGTIPIILFGEPSNSGYSPDLA
jgi:lipopolysaccharide/colanic/teichoic acid biosynthesis glycosyltransferase